MNNRDRAEAIWPEMKIYQPLKADPMTTYDNTNRGALFKNDRKTKDTQPGYTGSLNVDGVEYFLDAWVKEGKSGKFFSVSVKRKDQQAGPARAPAPSAAPAPQPAKAGGGFDDMDDDIPF